MTSVDIIIVAAGSGLRYGAPLPKQFCDMGGRPVLMHTVDALRSAMPEVNILLVISRDMEEMWTDLCRKHNFTSPALIYGGATRWESVRNAVLSPNCHGEVIMIHDAVRPIISTEMMQRICAALTADVDGVIPAVPVTDSLRKVEEDGTSYSIDRASMRAVQTPQAFHSNKLRKAYSLPYCDNFTDDASVMEAAGYDNIRLAEGSPRNIKITNPGDIAIAELYLKQS